MIVSSSVREVRRWKTNQNPATDSRRKITARAVPAPRSPKISALDCSSISGHRLYQGRVDPYLGGVDDGLGGQIDQADRARCRIRHPDLVRVGRETPRRGPLATR